MFLPSVQYRQYPLTASKSSCSDTGNEFGIFCDALQLKVSLSSPSNALPSDLASSASLSCATSAAARNPVTCRKLLNHSRICEGSRIPHLPLFLLLLRSRAQPQHLSIQMRCARFTKVLQNRLLQQQICVFATLIASGPLVELDAFG